jgi:hypothetical protein
MVCAYSDLTPLALMGRKLPTTAQIVHSAVLFLLGIYIPLSMPGTPSEVSRYTHCLVLLFFMLFYTESFQKCLIVVETYVGVL